jgi:hypothetical protein
MTGLGVVLLLAGLASAGVGIAGRVRATRLAMPQRPRSPFKFVSAMDVARLLYQQPELGAYVLNLLKASDRLLITGASLSVVGIVLML